MKALSKKRRKGGRPKRQDVDRTPSGQISRAGDAQLMTNLEMEAATFKRRQRVLRHLDKKGREVLEVFLDPHLSPSEARKQEHGSVIHRWHEESNIAVQRAPNASHPNAFTRLHRDTAESYAALHAKWLSAIDAKRMRSSSEFGGVGGHPPDPFIAEIARREQKTIEAFKEARRAILASGPLGMMAIETIVIENQPAVGMMGDLRQALNALAAIMKMQNAA